MKESWTGDALENRMRQIMPFLAFVKEPSPAVIRQLMVSDYSAS